MIGVGMLDRQIVLYTRTQQNDIAYGGVNTIIYSEQTEKIFAHVIWKSGKVET